MSRKSLCYSLALVFAFTVFNFLAHRESTRFFTEAAQQQKRELARQVAVSKAQGMGAHALVLAKLEARRSEQFEKERDDAIKTVLMQMQVLREQAAFIRLLAKTLGDNNIPLPLPPNHPAPESILKPQVDKST